MSNKRTKFTFVLQNVAQAKNIPTPTQMKRIILHALPKTLKRAQITVRIVAKRESRALNYRYRHKNAATNILSFNYQEPAEQKALAYVLGDLVVCAPLVAQEAVTESKPLISHWAHLLIHGTLHLLGFDHQSTADAEQMERREITLLADLGIANPYC
jgi:probable rRNA maturation factor